MHDHANVEVLPRGSKDERQQPNGPGDQHPGRKGMHGREEEAVEQWRQAPLHSGQQIAAEIEFFHDGGQKDVENQEQRVRDDQDWPGIFTIQPGIDVWQPEKQPRLKKNIYRFEYRKYGAHDRKNQNGPYDVLPPGDWIAIAEDTPQAKTACHFLDLHQQKSEFKRDEHQGESQQLGKDRRISQPSNGLTGEEVEPSDQDSGEYVQNDGLRRRMFLDRILLHFMRFLYMTFLPFFAGQAACSKIAGVGTVER